MPNHTSLLSFERACVLRSLLAVSLLVCCVSMLQAADEHTQHRLGLGLMVGEPSGISFAYHLTSGNKLAGSVGWSFDGEDQFNVTLDNTFAVQEDVFNTERLDWYLGLGGRFKMRDENKDLWGVRFPIGLAYRLEGERAEFFAEGVPIFDVLPSSDFGFNASLGFRFYF